MTGKSFRTTETEKERERERQRQTQTGGAAQGSLLSASPQQGFSHSRSIQQGAGGSQSHLRLLVWLSVILTLVQERGLI
jgi:hypothetical protein